jgi:radical SAM superfamily enzyme YgiQ (UPF0313 family)
MSPFRMGFSRKDKNWADDEVELDPAFSLGSRRMEAAVAGGPLNDKVDIRVFEWEGGDLGDLIADVEAYDPQLIGLSAYLWSLPTLLAAARTLKASKPSRIVLLGGPSARPAMLAHAPYRPFVGSIDALCMAEGEPAFTGVIDAMLAGTPLSDVPGLALPDRLGGWRNTPEAEAADLNELPSAYTLGRAKAGIGYIETYRGCPLSCSFCEWGVISAKRPPLSVENIVADFEALDPYCEAVFLVDAALNLNAKAFRNMREAERQTGFLSRRMLHCEVYPGRVTDDHLQFLEGVPATIGLGLQSIHADVLADVDRPFKEASLKVAVERLASVADVWVELILGLPGDSFEGFRQTLDAMEELPVRARVFHCLALPDGLMTRGKPEDKIIYDPISLEVSSCRGWPEGDIEKGIRLLEERGHADSRRYNPAFKPRTGPVQIEDHLGVPVLVGGWAQVRSGGGGENEKAS